MPNFTFPATNFPQNPNSRRDSSYAMGIIDTNHPDCKPSDLILADGFGEEFSSSFRACLSPTTDSHQKVISGNKILISTGDVPRCSGYDFYYITVDTLFLIISLRKLSWLLTKDFSDYLLFFLFLHLFCV